MYDQNNTMQTNSLTDQQSAPLTTTLRSLGDTDRVSCAPTHNYLANLEVISRLTKLS